MLHILTIPNPVLKRLSLVIKEISPEITRLIEDLKQTMFCHKHCVGIAAPQVGENIRLIVFDASHGRKPCTNNGLVVIINPIIVEKSGNQIAREGCLSVPDWTGIVTRAEKIKVEGLNELGERIHINSEGFESVIIQHETDHLDGILFLDRVTSLKSDLKRR